MLKCRVREFFARQHRDFAHLYPIDSDRIYAATKDRQHAREEYTAIGIKLS